MAGRSRGRNSNDRFHYVNPRIERSNAYDDQTSKPSTSRGGGGYSYRHGFNKGVTFKANQCGGNRIRKSWESKSDLIRDQLDREFSNRNGPPRNNTGRRSFPEQNHSHCGNDNFRNLSGAFKKSSTGWYSVFVPNVEDCDKFFKTIQNLITPVVFYPYNKQYFNNALRFLVDDFKVAIALHNTSYKITLKDDVKLVIMVKLYWPARGLISFTPVSTEVREKMIETMATRYNPRTKSLDLSQFHACSLFTNNQLFVPLNRPSVLLAALNMVPQHIKHDLYGLSLENNHIYLDEGLIWIRRMFPELKVLNLAGNKFSDLKLLSCLSGYTIHELNLSRNPVCNPRDKQHYERDVQELFPMLRILDKSEMTSRYRAVIGPKLKMPINFGNSFPIPKDHNSELPNPVMTLVELFLTQYYVLYDNQVSRQMVSECYHENATFTLSSCHRFIKEGINISQYLPESRNFLKSDINRQGRLWCLHKGIEDIITFLDKLPNTKHDFGSFIIDVPLATATMVQIVVNGVFAEDFKETNRRNIYRSFCRTFCLVPVESGWNIISDMLFVTVITDELLLESSKRFHVSIQKPVSLKINNSNGNINQNGTMSMMDTDEMASMETSSSYQQPPIPSCPSPSHKQYTFSSYQHSSIMAYINPQQLLPHQGGIQTSTPQVQQMASAATANFQPDSQQQSNASFPMFNTMPSSTKAIPTPSTLASLPINQFSTEEPVHLMSDTNVNPDKITMVMSFSNESGMNIEWAEKCLEENGWDYAIAASNFLESKATHTA